ncbi:hypothetical protein [Caenispirillum salinarum]|uniref:hypothetical protein n=1 Tax=Caenispirillum salinarum TaxID=859058 RepID=UPI00385134FB
MDVGSVTGMTVIVALLGVLVVGLLTYMSALVRRAYELKVELHNEIERGLKRIDEDLDAKNRRLKREVQDDIAKSKDAIRQDNERRHEETIGLVDGTLDAFREQLQTTTTEQNRVIDELRARHATLKREITHVNAALQKAGVAPAPSPSTSPAEAAGRPSGAT